MTDFEKKLITEYIRLCNANRKIQREIDFSVKGYVRKKNIKEKDYYYLQQRVGDTVTSKYIKRDEYPIIIEKIALRKDLEKDLKNNCLTINQIRKAIGKKKLSPIENIAFCLNDIFEDYKVKKATLFGSYAKGEATESSDVDILVDSGLKGLSFFGLLESVSEKLGKQIDLIDVVDVQTGSKVDKEIEKTGIVIFER